MFCNVTSHGAAKDFSFIFFPPMDKHRIGLKGVLPIICSMYFTEVESLADQNFSDLA